MFRYRLSAFADEAGAALEEQLAALKREKIGLIELRGLDGGAFLRLTDEEARAAKAKLDAAGVALSALGSPIGKIKIDDPFAPHLAQLERAIALGKIFGAKRIRMFSFFLPEGGDPARYRGEVLARLAAMLEVAEAQGLQLVHENEKAIYGDTDERCLDLLETFPGRLGCAFDPANFIQCGVKPLEAFARLRDKIDYMHIKDAYLKNGAVVPCGRGDGALREILDSLAQGDGEMILTIEPHLTVFAGLKDLQKEELTQAGEYSYPDAATAFHAAAEALKDTLKGLGFAQTEGETGVWTR